jgi:hypothetical protein
LCCSISSTSSRPGEWSYLIIFTAAALECAAFAGLLVPGESLVLASGFFAHRGLLKVDAVMAAASLGAIVGDNIGNGPQLGGLLHSQPVAKGVQRRTAARMPILRKTLNVHSLQERLTMARVLPNLLRLAAALAVAFLGLLAGLVVLDVIPREQLTTLGVKVVLLLGIFFVVSLVVTVLLRSGQGPPQSS